MTLFFINSVGIEKLAVIPQRSIPSFVRTKNILSAFELYGFFNQTDAHGLVCVQFLAALNSHLGGEKNISKNTLSEFFQNLSLQVLNELDETTNIKFDAINELNKFLMDEANKLINKKNQRLSFNFTKLKLSLWFFYRKTILNRKTKKIEENVVDNILNDFTIEHPQESDHLFYPNTTDEMNKQSQYEEEQKKN